MFCLPVQKATTPGSVPEVDPVLDRCCRGEAAEAGMDPRFSRAKQCQNTETIGLAQGCGRRLVDQLEGLRVPVEPEHLVSDHSVTARRKEVGKIVHGKRGLAAEGIGAPGKRIEGNVLAADGQCRIRQDPVAPGRGSERHS
jgi:hypothetical protein